MYVTHELMLLAAVVLGMPFLLVFVMGTAILTLPDGVLTWMSARVILGGPDDCCCKWSATGSCRPLPDAAEEAATAADDDDCNGGLADEAAVAAALLCAVGP